MVKGPAHGPQVDVEELAATPWAPVRVALSIFKELVFAVPHSSRDGSVVSSRDESRREAACPKSKKKAQYRPLDPALADTAA